MPSECWLLHPQHRSLLAILIFSIFIAVNVREIVAVFVPLRLDRLCLKCRRTNQDLADLFLFSPNIHGPFRPYSRHPSRFSYILFFVWILRLGKSPPSNRVGLLQSRGEQILGNKRRFHQFRTALLPSSLIDCWDRTISPAFFLDNQTCRDRISNSLIRHNPVRANDEQLGWRCE